MNTGIYREAIDLTEAQHDAENRVLRNVVLIRAGRSLNKRRYDAAVLEAAAPKFEGAKAYNDHDYSHSVRDITGWYTNVRFEGNAIRADRHFTRNQAGNDIYAVVEDILAGRAPRTLAGLSIAAVGKGYMQKADDGVQEMVIEAIDAVHSVDDVSEPAAGGTYLAASENKLLADVLAAMTFEDWYAARPEFMERVHKELKAVRQDDAVKAAKAEADHNRAALEAMQAENEHLTTERDAALAGEAKARRTLAVVEALADAKLPASWKASLREDLTAADPNEWAAIIEREIKKAKATGFKPRVDVTGAGQQVQEHLRVPRETSPVPREDEDVEAWNRRVHQQRT